MCCHADVTRHSPGGLSGVLQTPVSARCKCCEHRCFTLWQGLGSMASCTEAIHHPRSRLRAMRPKSQHWLIELLRVCGLVRTRVRDAPRRGPGSSSGLRPCSEELGAAGTFSKGQDMLQRSHLTPAKMPPGGALWIPRTPSLNGYVIYIGPPRLIKDKTKHRLSHILI